MSYYIISRYDVPGWLELVAAARPLFHRQHGVMAELAKWVVPILCRGPGEVVRWWWTQCGYKIMCCPRRLYKKCLLCWVIGIRCEKGSKETDRQML